MLQIRPVSDLRNNFADISKIVHETAQPVFLTKNGYGDMVVMSFEAYEKLQFESEIYFKLKEAEMQARLTNQRFSHKEVFNRLRQTLMEKADNENV
ncbi:MULTISPECIES: type II toxin-antitoxin system Phd/YefM family antitoxin [Syntrophomonas]|uniref:type II toxin-antitoxin system Phd/YefM family antitoxin n=1 Tax=Syntrophomonas TaxID=862 RepID=UPI0007731E60|nr:MULTISPECIES: type II toxin-antitoxin system Phd/YefM family antitoxin [Syntrophomonas]MDD4627292.1 type II toxin-antitoxin system Phd/YefM family antitoxin [Syntrophomonas sp.]